MTAASKTPSKTATKDNATGSVPAKMDLTLWTEEQLERLHFVGARRLLFQRWLSPSEKRDAYSAAMNHEEQRDSAKERGKSEADWVEEVLVALDGAHTLARESEAKLRKDLANAEAKVHDARRQEELLASALGYRWEEVTVNSYADDVALLIIAVRMDTMVEVSRRRMSEGEEKASEKRRQTEMFGGN